MSLQFADHLSLGEVNAEWDLIILTLFGVILVGLLRGNEVCDFVGYFVVELSAISAHPLRKLGSLVKISNHCHTNSPESLARLRGFHFLGGRASHGVSLQRVLEIGTQKNIDTEVDQGVVRGSRGSTRFKNRLDGDVSSQRIKVEYLLFEEEVVVRWQNPGRGYLSDMSAL